MSCKAALYVGKVTNDASDDTNMFSVIDKFDRDIIDSNGRDCFLVIDLGFVVGCSKYHKFCLFWGKGDVMGGAIVQG